MPACQTTKINDGWQTELETTVTSNPYAPPTAEVADIKPSEEVVPLACFAVSTTKFVVMSIATFSLYQVYWFYKHWKLFKDREGSSIVPVARAFFSVFFVYSLFGKIRDEAERVGVEPAANVGAAAIGWIVLTLIGNFSDKYFLISFLSVFCMVPIQACANRINQHVSPDHDPNSRITGWNIFWIVVGLLVIALSMIGAFLPEQ